MGEMGGQKPGWFKSLLLLPALLLFVSCSDETLSLFFDIPSPSPEEKAAAAEEKTAAEAKAAQEAATGAEAATIPAGEEAERPAIESVATWEQVEEMLPKDEIEEVDWMEALRQGIIRPRAAIDRAGNPEAAVFKWDFYFTGPDPTMDAYFPHSAHTQWLGCESCHPRIFRSREIEITMDKIFEQEFCGVCHGVVAFALDNCTRCHTAME
ncbi:MAG: c(7)-type cytochrome triheme domain-containing protein [Kiloniellaceae bacterium]